MKRNKISKYFEIFVPEDWGYECQHPNLVFLGMQEFPGQKPIKLWNCKDCHSTVTKPEEK